MSFFSRLSRLCHPSRPFPKFELGELAFLLPNDLTTYRPREYMLIKCRRWTRKEGFSSGVWVYDGTIFTIDHDKLVLVFRSDGIRLREELLKPIDRA
jgi:hypothetical protein